MEQKARGAPEKMGDAGLGYIDGTFKTRNESHNCWQLHEHRHGHAWGGGDYFIAAGARCCDEQTVKMLPKAAV
jgi:hypothetical protein